MQRLVNVAIGVGAVGALSVNFAYRRLQKKHKNAEYCSVPVELMRNKQRCTQLLGGGTIKVKNINLKQATLTTTKVKLEIPVKGNTRDGRIYTLSTREKEEADWQLQYAIFLVKSNKRSWTVWLHPENSQYDGELPDDIEEVEPVAKKVQSIQEEPA